MTVEQPKGSEYVPNFILPKHDVIHEDNWAEYEAKGFVPSIDTLHSAQLWAGTKNAYTGDAYDWKAHRPLRHKPGKSVYLSPEGVEQKRQRFVEHQRWMRAHGVTLGCATSHERPDDLPSTEEDT